MYGAQYFVACVMVSCTRLLKKVRSDKILLMSCDAVAMETLVVAMAMVVYL